MGGSPPSTNLILQLPQHGDSFSIATTARAPFVRQPNLVGESGEFRYSRALFRGVGLFVKTCVQQVKPSRHDASLPKFVLDELPRQQIVLRRLELLCRYDFHQQVVFVKRNRTRGFCPFPALRHGSCGFPLRCGTHLQNTIQSSAHDGVLRLTAKLKLFRNRRRS